MSITRPLGRMLDTVAPSVARRMRTIWRTLNGVPVDRLDGVLRQRTDALRHQMYGHQDHFDGRLSYAEAKLEALRIELGSRIERAARLAGQGSRDRAFLVADSLARLESRAAGPGRPIAVVSVLPPLETGIADYSLRTYEASPAPVDLFAPFDGAAAYLAASRRLPRRGGPLAVFALEALSAALTLRDYAAVVWVLGNSNHHLPIIRLLRETRHLPPLAPTWVQLHDPVLFNLARFHAEEMDSDLAALLRGAAPGGLPGADWDLVATGDIGSVAAHPGLPLRACWPACRCTARSSIPAPRATWFCPTGRNSPGSRPCFSTCRCSTRSGRGPGRPAPPRASAPSAIPPRSRARSW